LTPLFFALKPPILKTILQDLKIILKPLWLILLLQFVVLYAFWGASQGIDVLYCVIEDFSTVFKFTIHGFWGDAKILPFVAVLLSLFYWSLVSEFCSRLILYLSDFSSENLSIQKKYRRYYLTKNLPKLLFYFPPFVLMISFIHAFYLKTSQSKWTDIETYNLLALVVIEISLMTLLYLLYRLRYGKWSKRYRAPLIAYVDVVRLVGLTGVIESNSAAGNGIIKKYKPIFVIFLRLFSIAIISIALFVFAPTGLYEKIGATAFICMGFACWIVVYTIIEWITRKGIAGVQIPFKTLLFSYLLIVSYQNNDHPFRLIKNAETETRPSLDQYLQKWVAERPEMLVDGNTLYPIFIAAEGGALRTGCFSAMALASIQDSFPEFKNRIFCFSSVSGGTIGTAFFNALCQQSIAAGTYKATTKKFFEYDFLSPVTAKIAFGEPFNWMWFNNIQKCDRVIALEKAWEASWRNIQQKDRCFWQEGFRHNFQKYKNMPAHFINTTEVENGRRAIIAPVCIDSFIFTNTTDLCQFIKPNEDIPYSTAAGLSSRFPLISPAGFYKNTTGRDRSRHFVDGGYYENKGDITLLEIIKYVQTHNQGYVIKPIVIQLSFGDECKDRTKSISFLNEIQEIVLAMYNTRLGRTKVANQELKKYVEDSMYIEFYLHDDTKKVPMNWVLSNNALQRIENECKENLIPSKMGKLLPYLKKNN
jgi:hypothetical protein